MRKVILSSLFVFGMGMSSTVFGQNVEGIARKAAKEAGCIEENGAYNYSVTDIGFCASGPATTNVLTEVYILPKVSSNLAPYVKLSPIARVVLCGTEVQSVECL